MATQIYDNAFVQTLVSAGFLAKLRKSYVYGALTEKTYEGEIKGKGSTVLVNQIGGFSVYDYSSSGLITTPPEYAVSQVAITVDTEKAVTGKVADTDLLFQPSILGQVVEEMSNSIMDEIDSDIADAMFADIATANFIGTEASPKTDLSATTAYDYLVDLGTLLSENNVPKEGRWVVVPPWFTALLVKRNAPLVVNGTMNSDLSLKQGFSGMIAGFSLFESNNVPSTTSTTKFKIMAGVSNAVQHIGDVSKMRSHVMENEFSTRLDGLYSYGTKVTHPNALAVLVANRP